MLASSSIRVPSAVERRLVAVGDQPVLEVEELALHLAVGGGRLLVGADDDHAVAAVDDDQVAALDVVRDADDAGDRGDAAAPRQDRGVAGRAAGLGHDAGDRQVAEAHRLAGQDLVRDQDHRLVAVARVAGRAVAVDVAERLAGQVRADPRDHVADVGHPLAEIILLDPGELRRVALHDGLQGRQRRQVLVARSGRGPWTRSAGSLTI